jgi:hypothetical protein
VIAARRFVTVLAVLGSVALTPVAARAAGPNPLANPASNTMPSSAFVNACAGMGTTKAANDACDTSALVDFNAVRAGEGLGRMTLPRDFDTLTVPLQLLAISDIERVDRGLTPVVGLSSVIDARAQQGADADEDPSFPTPFVGDYESSNWAGAGNSALLDDFYWMYDDGLGSFNEDCTTADPSGCWGHRDDILGATDAPVLMGAAVSYQTPFGTSMAEQFVGEDTTDTADVAPTWAAIVATVPVGLSIAVSASRVKSHQRVTVSGTVTRQPTKAPIAHQRVELQRRHGSRWSKLAVHRSTSRGRVRFHLRPSRSATYRLEALSSSDGNDGVSSSRRILVR